MAIAIPVFFELTGMIVVTLFTPLLFYTIGFTSQKAILGSIITDVVSLASIAAAAAAVDRVGRRSLFMVGGAVLLACLVAMAWIFGAEPGTDDGEKAIPTPWRWWRWCACSRPASACRGDRSSGSSPARSTRWR